VARTIARRVERNAVALSNCDPIVLKYLNRLSDLLFTVGRFVTCLEIVQYPSDLSGYLKINPNNEVLYKPKCDRVYPASSYTGFL
jgi:hypothetical protein